VVDAGFKVDAHHVINVRTEEQVSLHYLAARRRQLEAEITISATVFHSFSFTFFRVCACDYFV
jgi:hypothetical protein